MKEKIYLITCGEYSDYHVVGYCMTREAAEKACAVQNSAAPRGADGHILYGCECSVEECASMEDLATGLTVARYFIPIIITNESAALIDWHGHTPGEKHLVAANIEPRASRCVDGIRVEVWLDKYAPQKAAKIAADVAAKFKAEEAGL